MAIVRKDRLAPYLEALERYYWELRAAASGHPAPENLAHDYHREADQFAAEFVDVDLARLKHAVDHFGVAVKHLLEVKTLVEKPIHRP